MKGHGLAKQFASCGVRWLSLAQGISKGFGERRASLATECFGKFRGLRVSFHPEGWGANRHSFNPHAFVALVSLGLNSLLDPFSINIPTSISRPSCHKRSAATLQKRPLVLSGWSGRIWSNKSKRSKQTRERVQSLRRFRRCYPRIARWSWTSWLICSRRIERVSPRKVILSLLKAMENGTLASSSTLRASGLTWTWWPFWEVERPRFRVPDHLETSP